MSHKMQMTRNMRLPLHMVPLRSPTKKKSPTSFFFLKPARAAYFVSNFFFFFDSRKMLPHKLEQRRDKPDRYHAAKKNKLLTRRLREVNVQKLTFHSQISVS
jgi:hypothetical protein